MGNVLNLHYELNFPFGQKQKFAATELPFPPHPVHIIYPWVSFLPARR